MEKRSNEGFVWSLFAAGGEMTALITPVMIFITGIAIPLGLFQGAMSYERMLAFLSHPIGAIILFGVIMLAACHAMHRFYKTLFDLGVRQALGLLSVLCYGAAAAATVIAFVVLLSLVMR